MLHPIDAFKDAIRSAGYEPPQDINPGQFHRFSANGKRSDTAGFCKLFDDLRGGIFGDFRNGITHEWQAQKPETMTAEQRQQHREAVERARQEREAELARVQQETREKAARIWAASPPANDNHPYLVRKQVKAFNIRESRGSLVIPVASADGTLQSLQFIDADGNKLFLKGGMKRGCYFSFGGKPVDRVIVAEGYATGASLHMAHGCPVAIAFDAGNLEPVCKALRAKLPEDIKVEIWADNDVNTPGNPGLTKANKVAAEIGATVIAPEAGDWNDVAVSQGLDAVRDVVVANTNQPVVYANLPDVNGRGKPLATIDNLAEICRRLQVTIRYDVIRKNDDILVPGVSFSIDNMANASLAWLTSECAKFNYPTGNISQYVTFLADQNLYNPAAQFVTSRPWDGISRVQAFYDTVRAKGDQRLKETLMKRWMISAIAAAFRPEGVSAHGVLVLQGDQYLGKTKWFKSLVPDDQRLTQDGWILRPDDKDSVKQACSFWLVELGELDATFRKADIAALKSFLTRDRDVLRRPYAHRESEFARRTVFFASVNPREFLHDITGNRRYWTIECEHIDHSHNLDMQQVWAEFHHMWAMGETWFLKPEEMEMLNTSNTEFEVRDPIEDRLMSRLDWQAPNSSWRWMTVLDVLIEVGIERPERNQLNTAGHIIRKLNGAMAKKTHGVRRVLVPPKPGEADTPF